MDSSSTPTAESPFASLPPPLPVDAQPRLALRRHPPRHRPGGDRVLAANFDRGVEVPEPAGASSVGFGQQFICGTAGPARSHRGALPACGLGVLVVGAATQLTGATPRRAGSGRLAARHRQDRGSRPSLVEAGSAHARRSSDLGPAPRHGGTDPVELLCIPGRAEHRQVRAGVV